MKHNFEQFKIQLILRNNQKRSKSAGKIVSPAHKRQSQTCPQSIYQKQIIKNSMFKKSLSTQRTTTSFTVLKDKEYKQFTNKCMNLLSKKTINPQQNKVIKKYISEMNQNKAQVKDDKRHLQQEPVNKYNQTNQHFQSKKTQRMHQFYNQQKVEVYRRIKSSKQSNRHRISQQRYFRQQIIQHEYFNPFNISKQIVCFTACLNKPANNKKNMFEAPMYRSRYVSNNKSLVQIAKYQQKSMHFQMNNQYDGQYIKKIKNFLDFLFKINYSNNIYVDLNLNKQYDSSTAKKYKAYIGKGNNSLLIKGLLKRRFWWDIVQNQEKQEINFCWTQNIHQKVHKKQILSNQKLQAQKVKTRKNISKEQLSSNKKILQNSKCYSVQNYIHSDGYFQPFEETFQPDLITNHLPRNYCIGSKKNLFKSLYFYFISLKLNPFDYIPKTYHIKTTKDPQYQRFVRQNKNQREKVWIVKPGENSNRGNGINLSQFKDLNNLIKSSKHVNGQQKTYIVQSYINKPLLYNNRKFDIRHYMLLTSINGQIKAYWYKQGYIRTSSEIFDLQDLENLYIHLTNDAVQRNSQDYQKYEPANKLSYSEFQRYLDYTYPTKNYNFQNDILPKMKEISQHIIKANYKILDHQRHKNNFQIFGLDFMIDCDFKPWLIQVNYNPCLQVNCLVLERVIPSMIQSSFRVALDPLFPPTTHYPASKRFYLSDNYLRNLKYQLIFHEQSMVNQVKSQYCFEDEKQVEQQYQDQGQQIKNLNI